MMYGLETVVLTKRLEAELEVAGAEDAKIFTVLETSLSQ